MARVTVASCDKCGAIAAPGAADVVHFRFTAGKRTPRKGDLCQTCLERVDGVLPKVSKSARTSPRGQPSPFLTEPVADS